MTLGAPQSNHARATASAAARVGLRAVLVVGGDQPAGPPTGNLLLDALFGAEVLYAGTSGGKKPASAETRVAALETVKGYENAKPAV